MMKKTILLYALIFITFCVGFLGWTLILSIGTIDFKLLGGIMVILCGKNLYDLSLNKILED